MSERNIEMQDLQSRDVDPSIELIKDFFSHHQKESEIRQRDQLLKEQELKEAHELAKMTLQAQIEFGKNAPGYSLKQMILFFSFIFCIILVITGIIIYCLGTGNRETANSIIQGVIIAVGSGGSGYAIGKQKGRKGSEVVEAEEVKD